MHPDTDYHKSIWPQTPMQIKLGTWTAGDSKSQGTSGMYNITQNMCLPQANT